jgi:hypothetical protein
MGHGIGGVVAQAGVTCAEYGGKECRQFVVKEAQRDECRHPREQRGESDS